jgi:hypothetical protein
MKNTLRMLSLALCMLPMCLHAGTGQDLKHADQPAQEQNARSADPIPTGTIIPVSLNSPLRSDKSASGDAITATVMQDVPLGKGETLRAGSKVAGHVVEAVTPGKGTDEPRISFQFDQVRLSNRAIRITAALRAVASKTAVLAATPQLTSSEYPDYQVQIGGDQTSYGIDGPVMVGSQVVGKYTRQGVLSYVGQNLETSSRDVIEDYARPQAFWLFSVNARGVYGFRDLTIIRSGRTEPAGEVTFSSNGRAVKVGTGSAMLLRVQDSGPEIAEGRTTPSRAIGQ